MSVQSEAFTPVWTFADRIRKVRTLTGLDQREFAALLGITAGALAQWETDRSQPRDIVRIGKRVEELTGIPAGWLLDVAPPSNDGQPRQQRIPLRIRRGKTDQSVGWSVSRSTKPQLNELVTKAA